VEEADRLAEQIGKQIARLSRQALRRINGKMDSKELWTAVRRVTGRPPEIKQAASISSESLNKHYAAISTDSKYPTSFNQAVLSDQANAVRYRMAHFPRTRSSETNRYLTMLSTSSCLVLATWSTGL
jgi:hypothetical protein